MKGLDLISVVIVLGVGFFVYRMSQPAYREFRQQRDETQMTFLPPLMRTEGFRGGEAIGGRGSGAAYQEIDFQDMNATKRKTMNESFRGGVGAGVGGSGTAYQEMNFKNMSEDDKKQFQEAFESIRPSDEVKGSYIDPEVLNPAPAALTQPRKPYNLLDELPAAPRGSLSCLKASCCAETDFEWRTNQTGTYVQRTNNYKREFPDNCTGPRQELTLAFYKNALLPKA